MGNRLAQETSPYLLEHADNPVDWFPWGAEALARARTEHKPILLSIGYSACHWCHVMARESFEDPDTAALMNRDFVSIKVDREERPDLDQIYMRAVQGMTGSGGWPMTVFLLPDGTPFFAGTYFPPHDRFGMPSFKRVLTAVADAFTKRPADVAETAAQVRDFLNRPSVPLAVGALTPALLDEAAAQLARDFDPVHAGFGGAPQFPQPLLVEALLRHHVRTGQPAALEMALQTLRAMAAGGMYDQLGGGFHRYSVDERWLVPHFEKMLYDNALLARLYLAAGRALNEPEFLGVARDIFDYVLREMTSPEGGFYAAQDADSEGVEGKFFVWAPEQVDAVIGPELRAIAERYFDISIEGNFEDANIPHRTIELADAARVFKMSEDEMASKIREIRAKLFAAREQRVKPGRDEKILVAWNAMMIGAFAEGYRALHDPRYLEVAERAAGFIMSKMWDGRALRRSFKDGVARHNAYLEDYAQLAGAMLDLYEASLGSENLAHDRTRAGV